MPSENETIKFKNYQRQLRVPMYITYNTEALQRPLTAYDYEFDQRTDKYGDVVEKAYQKCPLTRKHELTGYHVKIRSDHPELLDELDNITESSYTGPDAEHKLAMWFLNQHVEVFKKCNFNKKLEMTREDWAKHNGSDNCGICGEEFMDSKLNDVISDLRFEKDKVIQELKNYKDVPDFYSFKIDDYDNFFVDDTVTGHIQEAFDEGHTYEEVKQMLEDNEDYLLGLETIVKIMKSKTCVILSSYL